MAEPRTLTTSIEKTDIDREFNDLKRESYNIIEASVPGPQQKGAKQLVKNVIDGVRITMLRWFQVEREGEYDGTRKRKSEGSTV